MPVAGSACVLAATVATVATSGATATPVPPTGAGAHEDVITSALAMSEATVSRSAEREPVPTTSDDQAEDTLYASDDIEVRSDAGKGATVLATVHKGDAVAATGVTKGEWTQIIHNDLPRWVKSDELSTTEPSPDPEDIGVSFAPCASGSGVESGLRPDSIKVHRAVCAAFPQISSYGGVAGRGEHATGQALDIMVSGPLGWQIAEFLQANRTRLGVSYLIYQQKIWTVQRGGEGWRAMSDRGGATANHFDHVHVTTYGNRGTG